MHLLKKRRGLALALAVMIALLLWNREALFPGKSAAAKADRDSRSFSSDSFQETRRRASPRPKLTKTIETDSETPAALHFRNFVIRSVHLDGEQGLPLAEAVARVKAEYFKTAKETQEDSLSLTVDLSQANISKTLALKLPRGPVTSVLRLLAAASGNRLVGSGPSFRMELLQDDGSKGTRTLVSRAFSDSIFKVDEEPDLNAPPHDPFTPFESAPDIRGALLKLGFEISRNTCVLSENTDYGVVTNISNATASELELLDAANEMAHSDAMHQQVKMSSKIIQMPADFEWPEDAQGTINEGRFQTLMRQLAQTEGADLITAPSVAARYGQLSSIEIFKGADDPSSPLWSGTRIRYAAQPLGTGTEDFFQLIQSTPNAERVSDATPLSRVTVSGSGTSNQDSVQVTVANDPAGARVVYVHRSQRIDATGRPLDSSGKPINPP